jgi:hypothetical protein
MLSVIVLFASCEKEIEFDKKLIEPKLVVNSFIQQDSLINVSVASSKPIPGTQSEFKWIDNATVKLFVDGVEKETLTAFDLEKKPTGFQAINFDTTFFYDTSAPSKRYSTLNTKAEAGKTYRLEVTHPDFEKAVCETYIPKSVPILSIDTLTKTIVSQYNTSSVLEVKIKFQDTPGEKNYYRLVYRNQLGVLMDDYKTPEANDNFILISDQVVGTSINSDDQLINPKNEDANDLLFSSSTNRYNLFTDELIEGKEYELSFNLFENYYTSNYKIPKGGNGEFMRLTIELHSLTREAYLYMRSVAANNSADGFFTEPVQVFTNVDNGIGIFAGFSASQKSISKGEYPVEGVKYQTDKEYFGGW